MRFLYLACLSANVTTALEDPVIESPTQRMAALKSLLDPSHMERVSEKLRAVAEHTKAQPELFPITVEPGVETSAGPVATDTRIFPTMNGSQSQADVVLKIRELASDNSGRAALDFSMYGQKLEDNIAECALRQGASCSETQHVFLDYPPLFWGHSTGVYTINGFPNRVVKYFKYCHSARLDPIDSTVVEYFFMNFLAP